MYICMDVNCVLLHLSFFVHIQGLYPESHGIVDNKFFDKKLNETFYISSPDVNDEKWWLGEPVIYFFETCIK